MSSGCVSLHREGRGKRLLFRLRETESEVGAAASEEGRECLRSRATEFRAEKHFVTSIFQKIFAKNFATQLATIQPMARTSVQQRNKEATKLADLASARTAVNTSTMAAAALVPADKPLTDKQRQFVKFWAEGDTIPNAMQRAGYNEQPSYGYRMAKMPNILVEFDRIKAKWEEAAQTSRQQVMEMHKEAFEMAKMMAEPATMVSAAREIGRMCGYYEPVKQKIEFTVNGQIAVKRLESMSDEDLIRLVTEGLQAGQAAALGQDAQEALEMAQDDEITDV